MYPHSQTGHLYRLRKKLMREGNKARTADFSIGPTLQDLIDEATERASELPCGLQNAKDDKHYMEEMAHRIVHTVVGPLGADDYAELLDENPWLSALNDAYWDAISPLIEERVLIFLNKNLVETTQGR